MNDDTTDEITALLRERGLIDNRLAALAAEARARAREITAALPEETQQLLRAWVAAKRAVKRGERVLKLIGPQVLTFIEAHPGGIAEIDSARVCLGHGTSYRYSADTQTLAEKLKMAREVEKADGTAKQELTPEAVFAEANTRADKAAEAELTANPPTTLGALMTAFVGIFQRGGGK